MAGGGYGHGCVSGDGCVEVGCRRRDRVLNRVGCDGRFRMQCFGVVVVLVAAVAVLVFVVVWIGVGWLRLLCGMVLVFVVVAVVWLSWRLHSPVVVVLCVVGRMRVFLVVGVAAAVPKCV